MDSAKIRAESELKQLQDRAVKLHNFMESDTFLTFSKENRVLMCIQYDAMGIYAKALAERLNLWEDSPSE